MSEQTSSPRYPIKKVLTALLQAPIHVLLIFCPLMTIAISLVGSLFEGAEALRINGEMVPAYIYGVAICYVVEILVVLPLFLVMRHLSWVGPRTCIFVGLLCGLPLALISLMDVISGSFTGLLSDAAVFNATIISSGPLIGWRFWKLINR